MQGAPFLVPQHREVSALLKEFPNYLGFLAVDECDDIIRFLIPLLSKVLERRDAYVTNNLEEKTGRELLAAILERRQAVVNVSTAPQPVVPNNEESQMPHRKRGRSPSPDDEAPIVEGAAAPPALVAAVTKRPATLSVKAWVWFDASQHKIQKFLKFGNFEGKPVFYVVGCQQGKGKYRSCNFVVDIENLKALDHLNLSAYKKTMAVLVHGLDGIGRSAELVHFLAKTEWGAQLMRQEGLLQ